MGDASPLDSCDPLPGRSRARGAERRLALQGALLQGELPRLVQSSSREREFLSSENEGLLLSEEEALTRLCMGSLRLRGLQAWEGGGGMDGWMDGGGRDRTEKRREGDRRNFSPSALSFRISEYRS